VSKVTVRAYNVGFGDAILVTVPDRNPKTRKETTRNVLIDVGIKKGIGGASLDDLKTVVLDIRKRLEGRAIDLYVMTHEHYDHVAGLFHAKDTWGLGLEVDYSWITASANPAFLRRNPAIRELRQRMRLYCEDVERRIALQTLLRRPLRNSCEPGSRRRQRAASAISGGLPGSARPSFTPIRRSRRGRTIRSAKRS
jgi:glyoxylase-like metal-dependent hydrolase (beta-lactamase superfamily II)